MDEKGIVNGVKLKSLEEAIQRAPFSPFFLHIDGKNILVEHPEQVLFSHDRGTVVVAPRDNRIHIIDVDQVQFVTLLPRKKVAK